MIYGLFQHVQEDGAVLWQKFVKGEKIANVRDEEQRHRVEVAAARMFAALAMAFMGLWALSILTFVVTLPLQIALKLALAVSGYVLAYDVFKMCQNSMNAKAKPDSLTTKFFDLWKGQEVNDQKKILKFTNGTILQSGWMWLYFHRHEIVK